MKVPQNAKKVFTGQIFDVYQWEQVMYDGSWATFEMLGRPDTVEVIATSGEQIYYARQSQPTKDEFIGLFGGRVEEGEEPLVAAKRELVAALPQDGAAVLNIDDPRVMSMADHTRARVFTYGLDPAADLWADDIDSMGLSGVRFTLHHDREALSVRVPLLGRHSVHTALRAAAVGLLEGLRWDEIVAGLNAGTSQLRLVVSDGPRGSVLIDDTYNSSPDSALAALNLLADLPGRHIAVLGDMLELGRAEKQAHRVVGRRAADVADIVIAVGERARIIGAEALALGMATDRVHVVAEAPAAVPILEGIIQAGDVVLVKGSLGMRMDRIVAALGRIA